MTLTLLDHSITHSTYNLYDTDVSHILLKELDKLFVQTDETLMSHKNDEPWNICMQVCINSLHSCIQANSKDYSVLILKLEELANRDELDASQMGQKGVGKEVLGLFRQNKVQIWGFALLVLWYQRVKGNGFVHAVSRDMQNSYAKM